ncbi:MAG: hypothetical protein WAJ94_10155 [Candidatus Cybelea sp.]
MRVSTVLRIALCTTGIAVALLAGCGTLQPSIGAPDRMLQTRATTADADRSESWMKPNASKALLYFDDDITNDTYVYDYPSGKLVGKLTGFHDPQGMCVDRKGDVYITNPQYGLLFEYAHGGVKPINIYERPGVGLNGCSVSATGDVAATGGGEVCIWKGGIAHDTPTCVDDNESIGCEGLSPFGYDHAGNLIGMGSSSYGGTVTACIIQAGKNTMEKLATSGINFNFGPRGTAWDGKYITLSGVLGNGDVVQPAKLSGTRLIAVGPEIMLDDQPFMPGSPFFFGKQNVTAATTTRAESVTIANPRYHKGAADVWNYPKGGEATLRIRAVNDSGGDAISIAK